MTCKILEAATQNYQRLVLLSQHKHRQIKKTMGETEHHATCWHTVYTYETENIQNNSLDILLHCLHS